MDTRTQGQVRVNRIRSNQSRKNNRGAEQECPNIIRLPVSVEPQERPLTFSW